MYYLNLPERTETSRLILQKLRYEDAEEIFYAYASKPEVTKFLSWKTHESVDETRSFLKYAHQSWKAGLDYSYSIRLKINGQLIGGFGFINEGGKIQFGYAFSPTHWNNGYATEVCTHAMMLIRKCDNIFRVGTFVDSENIASIRVLEKSGLVKEAELANWFRFINQGNEPKNCVLYFLPLGN